MNKQVELEQAYWRGFSTKCAEMGVDAEKLAQETNTPAAKAPEPDWLDTSPDSSRVESGSALAGRGRERALNNNRYLDGESARITRAIDSIQPGPRQVPRRDGLTDWASHARDYQSRPDRIGQIQRFFPEMSQRDSENVGLYDQLRKLHTPRESEAGMRRTGVGTPQIEFIRELIRKGIIQANTRRPASGTAIG